jgi:hypothetical protein
MHWLHYKLRYVITTESEILGRCTISSGFITVVRQWNIIFGWSPLSCTINVVRFPRLRQWNIIFGWSPLSCQWCFILFSDYNDTKAVDYLNNDLCNTLGNLLSRCTSRKINTNMGQIFPALDREILEWKFSQNDIDMYRSLQQLPGKMFRP